MSCCLKSYFYFAEQSWILCKWQLKPSMLLGMVNTSAKTSPSELRMKQSCLSLATSIMRRGSRIHLIVF